MVFIGADATGGFYERIRVASENLFTHPQHVAGSAIKDIG